MFFKMENVMQKVALMSRNGMGFPGRSEIANLDSVLLLDWRAETIIIPPTIEEVVIYSSYYLKEAFDVVKRFQPEVPPEKIEFIICNCDLKEQVSLFLSSIFSSSKLRVCECGGEKTMRNRLLSATGNWQMMKE